MSSKVVIGKFGSVHGVRGDIKVHSFTESSEDILEYQPWQFKPTAGSDWKVLEIMQSSWHNNQLVVRIAGFTDRDEAKRLTNLEIAIERDQLPTLSQDEHYWSDLTGLTVVNTEGEQLGIVDGFIETGSNDVMAIKDEKGGDHLIPYTDHAIKEVDMATKTITVDWELL